MLIIKFSSILTKTSEKNVLYCKFTFSMHIFNALLSNLPSSLCLQIYTSSFVDYQLKRLYRRHGLKFEEKNTTEQWSYSNNNQHLKNITSTNLLKTYFCTHTKANSMRNWTYLCTHTYFCGIHTVFTLGWKETVSISVKVHI